MAQHQQRVYAIRHGESAWNVQKLEFPDEKDSYRDELYLPDCDITDKGKEQSRQAGVELKNLLGNNDSFTLIISPLRRAIQTAHHMLEASGLHPSKTMVVPAAAEVLRDACDIGTPAPILRSEFPHLPLQDLEEFWWPYGRPAEETWERMKSPPHVIETDTMIEYRIQQLRDCIARQQHHTPVVVVVCHSETIWWLTTRIGERIVDGKADTKNCEIVDVTPYWGLPCCDVYNPTATISSNSTRTE